MAGGGAKNLAKAVATAGDATRGGGSGCRRPAGSRAARFRPYQPSMTSWRRRSGCGAKLVDLDGDEAVGQSGDVTSGAEQNGVAAGAGHGAEQNGAAAGAGHGAEQDGVAARAGHGAEQDSEKTCK
jgi:hypothetical protein